MTPSPAQHLRRLRIVLLGCALLVAASASTAAATQFVHPVHPTAPGRPASNRVVTASLPRPAPSVHPSQPAAPRAATRVAAAPASPPPAPSPHVTASVAPAPAPTPVAPVAVAALTPAAILAGVHYRWQQLGYRIEFLGPQPGYSGMTYPGPRLIDIYLSPGEPLAQATFVTAYELGHALDIERNTTATRSQWLTDRQAVTGTQWWACDACNEDAAGAGDFSNVFAWWATGVDLWRSTVAPQPNLAQRDALAAQFWGGR